jgi:serine/threonine protein phosphatase PrpC
MTKYQITIIGEFHTNHNEDCLFSSEIGKSKLLIAVMDGCSAAIDSHFSATLTAKLLKRIAKEEDYKEFVTQEAKDVKQLLKDILVQLFKDLAAIKSKIGLEREELLNTLILGIVNTHDKIAEIIVIGDGIITCNGQFFEYDQNLIIWAIIWTRILKIGFCSKNKK